MKRLIWLLLFVATTMAHADPRRQVQQAFDQLLGAGGFRGYAQGRLWGPQAPPMSGNIEVEFPDRIHAKTESFEFVAIGGDAWIRAMGLWVVADRSLLPVTAFDPAAMRAAIASIKDVRIEGAAKTALCAAHEYRFHANGTLPAARSNGEVRAWICDVDGRLARLEATDGQSGSQVAVDFDWTRRPAVQAPTE